MAPILRPADAALGLVSRPSGMLVLWWVQKGAILSSRRSPGRDFAAHRLPHLDQFHGRSVFVSADTSHLSPTAPLIKGERVLVERENLQASLTRDLRDGTLGMVHESTADSAALLCAVDV